MTNVPASKTELADRIDAFLVNVRKNAPPGILEKSAAEMRKITEGGIAARALQVGAKAPDLTLPDSHGTPFHLAAQLAKGPVVVSFYRGGWCPFCDFQLRAYQGILPQIRDLGAELVAISPQTPDYVLSDTEKKALTFPVLSDRGNVAARTFGLVFPLSQASIEVQHAFGSVLPKFNGDDSWELPVPATFVLDRDGVARLSYVDADSMKRLEPSAILDALAAIKRAA